MSTLDTKTREMVALAAAVAANCRPCLQYHFKEAVKQGCTAQEIQEIVKVAGIVKQRPENDVNDLATQLLNKLGKAKG